MAKRASDCTSTLSALAVAYIQSLFNAPSQHSKQTNNSLHPANSQQALSQAALENGLRSLVRKDHTVTEAVLFLLMGLQQVTACLTQVLPRSTLSAKTTRRSSQGRWRPHKRIGIAGLLNKQIEEMKVQCGELADLHFLGKDLSRRTLPEVDHLIIATKWVSHPVDDAALSQLDKDCIQRCPGGMTTLIALVKRLAQQ